MKYHFWKDDLRFETTESKTKSYSRCSCIAKCYQNVLSALEDSGFDFTSIEYTVNPIRHCKRRVLRGISNKLPLQPPKANMCFETPQTSPSLIVTPSCIPCASSYPPKVNSMTHLAEFVPYPSRFPTAAKFKTQTVMLTFFRVSIS